MQRTKDKDASVEAGPLMHCYISMSQELTGTKTLDHVCNRFCAGEVLAARVTPKYLISVIAGADPCRITTSRIIRADGVQDETRVPVSYLDQFLIALVQWLV